MLTSTFNAVALSNTNPTVLACIPVHHLANRWHQLSGVMFPLDEQKYKDNTFLRVHGFFTVNNSTGNVAIHFEDYTECQGIGFCEQPKFDWRLICDTVVFLFTAGSVERDTPIPTRCFMEINKYPTK